MEPIERGHYRVETDRPASGTRYAYALDGESPRPDPLSRWQPDGVRGFSAVWWPEPYAWNEGTWTGPQREGLVFYELHVGTFTPEGTFDGVVSRLDELLELGITAIELMPVGEFPGDRGWGYDVVFPFAPHHRYGGPDGLRRLVETCHQRGMAVFLDVVYNHFGPEGNVFPRYGDYLTDRYHTDWGPALNFDGRASDPVRAMVMANARQWIRDFRIDGLRLDAADQIYDRSPRSILSELAEAVHREGDRLGRRALVFAETDLNDANRFLHPLDRGGHGLDGHWNDDFHHAVHATLTGETSGYYADFANGPEAISKAFTEVFVNNGNYSRFRDRRHGARATDFTGDRFVAFIQNHDQVGNRLKSDRLASILSPAATRLAAGLLLLAPRLPLLFMGEEYGETNPFPYFCDYQGPELVKAVREGRKAEFAYFGWTEEIPDPVSPATRDQAVLSWRWDTSFRQGIRSLYRELIRLRRESPPLREFEGVSVGRLGPPEGGEVLDLRRVGRNEGATHQLQVLFNLSPTEADLPENLWRGGSLVLRSESQAFGGPLPRDDGWSGRLRPHEFVILSREPSG
jgi:maltooligosyltrehalose trehalohydrolase